MTLRAIAVFLAFVATAAAAELRRAGDVIFEPPPSWRVGRADDRFVTLLNDDRKDGIFVTARIYQSAVNEKSPITVWARQVMDQDLKADEQSEPQDRPTNESRVGNTSVTLLPRLVTGRGRKVQLYVAMKLPDRYQLTRFEGPADDEKQVRKSFEILARDFQPMYEKFRFISKGAQPLEGKPVAGDLNGVYFGSRLQNGIGFDGNSKLDLITSLYTFFPDGTFYDGVPSAGVKAFDYASAAAARADRAGVYVVAGEKLTLKFADGRVATLGYSPNKGTLSDRGAVLARGEFPENGFRFAGTATSSFYAGIMTGVEGRGGVSSARSWTFRNDGSYTTDGSGGASASFDNGGGFAVHNKDAGRGKYEVRDGILTLTADTGETKTWPIFKFGESIVVNEMFVKR